MTVRGVTVGRGGRARVKVGALSGSSKGTLAIFMTKVVVKKNKVSQQTLPALAPISLSSNVFNENTAPGTVIASLLNLTGGVTPILSGNSGGRVAISGNNLVVGSTNTDFEVTPSLSIQFTQNNAGYNNSPLVTNLTLTVINQNDTSPNAFSFTDVSGAALSTLETSNTITIAGLGASDSATATISGAASSQIQKNGGAWGGGPVTVVNGDQLTVRHNSAGTNSAAVSTTLTVGGTSDTFTSTTVAAAALGTLTLSSLSFTAGASSSGTILGATPGSTITVGGTLPSGLTIDGAARTWTWDGTAILSSSIGSFDLVETLAGYSNSPEFSPQGYAIISSVTYDTRVGDGVDSNGFAQLPLKTAGTDGPNLLTGAPTTTSSASWDNSTKTLTMTSAATNAVWSGLLTPDTDYHVQFSITSSASCDYAISDGVNNLLFIQPFNGTQTWDLLLHTTTGTDLQIITADSNVAATIQITKVAANTGGIAGARFFVNPTTGDDTRSFAQAQNPATPVATVAAARRLVRHRAGDQILVAEGSILNEILPPFSGEHYGYGGSNGYKVWSGASAQYPAVIQTYDPADALNEAKYGRADQRNARPKARQGTVVCTTGASGQGYNPNYIVLRGIDFDTGANTLDQPGLGGVQSNIGSPTHLLLENLIFRYSGWALDFHNANGINTADALIVRNCSMYGSSSAELKGGNIFYDGWISATLEDNIFYHNGWKIGASRTDDYPVGGPTVYKHSVYQQSTNGNNCVTRRNLFADGAADGGQFRSGGVINENFFLDNPIVAALGGGTSYNLLQPDGVSIEFAYNACLGAVDLGGGSPEGNFGDPNRCGGISIQNGKPGSSVHHNLLLRNSNPAGPNVTGLENSAGFNQPSYCDFNANLLYAWAASGRTNMDGGTYPAQVSSTRTNNVWDDPSAGSNANVGSYAAPNPYTAAELWTALGYADKAAWIDDAINHPEKHLQRAARAKLYEGYGVDQGTVARTAALSSSTFVVGVAKTVRIVGVNPGTILTISGNPASFTINSAARTLTYDGTGSITNGSFTLSEAGHETVIAYAIGVAPATLNPADMTALILSSGNLKAAANGPMGGVRATRSVANGQSAYWEVTPIGYSDMVTLGVVDAAASFASTWFVTNSPNTASWLPGQFRYNGTTAGYSMSGNIARFAVKVSADGAVKTLWLGNDTGWLNGDPAAGTGGTDISAMGAPFPAFQGDASDNATFNFGATPFAFGPPAGFGNL